MQAIFYFIAMWLTFFSNVYDVFITFNSKQKNQNQGFSHKQIGNYNYDRDSNSIVKSFKLFNYYTIFEWGEERVIKGWARKRKESEG